MKVYVRDESSKLLKPVEIVSIKGDRGPVGSTPDLQIGEVTTLDPGQQATVTKRGTKEEPVFDFGVPSGATPDMSNFEDKINKQYETIEKKIDDHIENHPQGGGSASIDDAIISTDKTWSSNKIEDFVHTNDDVIWSTVQGENLSVDYTKEGYLREVEIWGNTKQNQDNLSDIQHLGTWNEEKQGYEVEIKSCNYTSINDDFSNIRIRDNFAEINHNQKQVTLYSNRSSWINSFIEIVLNKDTVVGDTIDISFESDIAISGIIGLFKNYGWSDSVSFNNTTTLKYNKKVTKSGIDTIRLQIDSPYNQEIKIKLRCPKSYRTTIILPCQLMKVGDIADKLYWDSSKGRYVIEKNIVKYEILDTDSKSFYKNSLKTHSQLHINPSDTSGWNTIVGDFIVVSNYSKSIQSAYSVEYNNIYCSPNKQIIVIVENSSYNDDFEGWVNRNKPFIFRSTNFPQLIDTDIREEIKLPTFINHTYVSVNGGIQGSIKAKAPVDGGKVIGVLQEENIKLKEINKEQDELINTTMLATDEMYMMLEPLLAETLGERSASKLVNMYVAMVQRGLIKTIDQVPVRYRDSVTEILNTCTSQ